MSKVMIGIVGALGGLILAFGLTSVNTADMSGFMVTLRLADPPPAPTVTVDLLCDRTATCTEDALRITLDDSLDFCAARPGSTTRLWSMGRSVEDLELVATATSSEIGKGRKGRAAAARRFVDREGPRMLAAAKLVLADAPPTSSPITESLTAIAWAESRTPLRQYIAITDGRQVSRSLADFECRPLPDEDDWIRRLAAHRLLDPSSLEMASVHFAFLSPTPVDGRECAVSIEREAAIRSLWAAAIERAGGTLHITAGPANLNDEPKGELK